MVLVVGVSVGWYALVATDGCGLFNSYAMSNRQAVDVTGEGYARDGKARASDARKDCARGVWMSGSGRSEGRTFPLLCPTFIITLAVDDINSFSRD